MKPLVAAVAVLVALVVGVQAQTPEYFDELRTLAEQGNADAQSMLAFEYATGIDVPQDAAEAMRWYRLAAEQGHATAQYFLGTMYADGRGVPQDDTEAVRWWRLAAEQGQATAMSNLGAMYAAGRGVVQDSVQSHMWRNLAASRLRTGVDREPPPESLAADWPCLVDRELSVEARDAVASLMTAEQLAEAQRLAREWDAAHPREP